MKKHDSQHHVTQKRKSSLLKAQKRKLNGRNWIAVRAHERKSAGPMQNRKRQEERRLSRKKYRPQDYE